MINVEEFYNVLVNNNFDYFAGVPDSLLKKFLCHLSNNKIDNHIVTANEGNAIALASGYNIATGKYGVVYMQNSGIGNAINPLLSLSVAIFINGLINLFMSTRLSISILFIEIIIIIIITCE